MMTPLFYLGFFVTCFVGGFIVGYIFKEATLDQQRMKEIIISQEEELRHLKEELETKKR